MSRSLPSNRPPRILVTRTDRIGDLVLSTPVFSALRRKFPDAWIAVLTFAENREIVGKNPDLDEVILYDKKGDQKNWPGQVLFALRLKRKKFDLVIHLHATNRMHFVSWMAGIPVRIGWNRRMPWALTHVLPYVKKEGKKHEAEYNFDLLAPLDIAYSSEFKMFFPVTQRNQISVEELLKQRDIKKSHPLVVLSPGASDPSKVWCARGFAEVAEKIAAKYDVALLMIGTRQDRPYLDAVKKYCSVEIHDLSAQLSIGMLGALLGEAALLICNDSGPVHIAQALGRPVVSVFVRQQAGINPDRWRPLCKNSQIVLTAGTDDAASAGKVFEAVESFAAVLKETVIL